MQEQIRLNAVDVDENLRGFIVKTMDVHKENSFPIYEIIW